MQKLIYSITILIFASASLVISYQEKNSWTVTILTLFILVIYNFPKIFEYVQTCKIGKDGIELKAIAKHATSVTKEAEATISILRNMAILLVEKTSEIAAKTGRWDTGYTAKELYDLKVNLNELLSNLNIEKQDVNTKEIDRIIIQELFERVVNRYINNNQAIYDELYTYIDKKGTYFFVNIDKVQKCLEKEGLLDEQTKKLTNEICYFQKNGSFMSEDIFKRVMSKDL